MSYVEFTSEVVRGAKFREKLKGYHPEDVDGFMERAAVAIDQLTARLAEATARALKAEAALAGNSEADESVRRTLVLAQRTAEMAVREANEEAQRLRVDARAEAEQMRADAAAELERAKEEASRIEALATAHATETVDEADAAAEAMRTEAADQVQAMKDAASERIADERAREDSERTARELAATEQIEARTAALERQYDAMWQDVSSLSAYLATERARLLEALNGAVERFGETLQLSPAPHRLTVVPAPEGTADDWSTWDDAVSDAEDAEDTEDTEDTDAEDTDAEDTDAEYTDAEDTDDAADADDAEVVSAADTVAPDPAEDAAPTTNPAAADPALDGAATVGLLPDESDPEWTPSAWGDVPPAPVDEEPPSRLLFTLDDERRRAEAEADEVTSEPKPKKTLLGRRRG